MRMNSSLRVFMTLAFGGLVVWAAAHAAPPMDTEKAMKAKTVKEAMTALGAQGPDLGRRVLLDVPDIVDGGKKVSVTVTSKMPGTDWIGILVDRHPEPLQFTQDLPPAAEQTVEAKVDLIQTSRVTALVRAGGKFYQVSREVKVAFEVPKAAQR